jgi:hypothetical protein
MVLPILFALDGELLSPSSPNSVSNHKKTSLSGWFALPPAHLLLAHRSFSSANLTFLPPPLIPVDYSNSK